MLIEFEDFKQNNSESNEAMDDEISQLRSKQEDLKNKNNDANDHIKKLQAENNDCEIKYNEMKDSLTDSINAVMKKHIVLKDKHDAMVPELMQMKQ